VAIRRLPLASTLPEPRRYVRVSLTCPLKSYQGLTDCASVMVIATRRAGYIRWGREADKSFCPGECVLNQDSKGTVLALLSIIVDG
jgi:hypothetical protein